MTIFLFFDGIGNRLYNSAMILLSSSLVLPSFIWSLPSNSSCLPSTISRSLSVSMANFCFSLPFFSFQVPFNSVRFFMIFYFTKSANQYFFMQNKGGKLQVAMTGINTLTDIRCSRQRSKFRPRTPDYTGRPLAVVNLTKIKFKNACDHKTAPAARILLPSKICQS